MWLSGPRERWRIKVAKFLLKSRASSLPLVFLVAGAGRWWTKGQLLQLEQVRIRLRNAVDKEKTGFDSINWPSPYSLDPTADRI